MKFCGFTVCRLLFFIGIPSRHKFKPAFATFSFTSVPLYILLNFPVSTCFFYFFGALAWSIITLARSWRTSLTNLVVTCFIRIELQLSSPLKVKNLLQLAKLYNCYRSWNHNQRVHEYSCDSKLHRQHTSMNAL